MKSDVAPPAVHPFLIGIVRGSAPETLLPLAAENRDWEEIVREAAVHGLTSLLYRWLKQSGVGRQLPAEAGRRLEAHFFGLAARNMVLADELGSILRAFEKRQLPCAPLRGLALAELLYDDLITRPMGDIDLLVRKEDLPAVATILRSLGFREMDRRPGFAQAFSYTLKFFKDRHGWIIVEPHWTITYPPFVERVDMEEVWKRCVRGRVVDVETWVLGREELLLHLCLHLTHRDGSAPLLWLYELDRLLRQDAEAVDWSRFLAIARQAKLELLLSQTFGKAKSLFATPIPVHVLDALTREPPRSAEGRMVRWLAGASSVDGKESLAVLFALKGFCPKLRYALALLFPSPEFMLIQYGLTRRRQLGLACLQRVCRFAWEGLKGILKLLS